MCDNVDNLTPERIICHESGHVVAMTRLGRPPIEVNCCIVRLNGIVKPPPPPAWLRIKAPLNSRSRRFLQREVVINLAGPIAEGLFFPDSPVLGERKDMEAASRWTKVLADETQWESGMVLERLRHCTHALFRCRWSHHLQSIAEFLADNPYPDEAGLRHLIKIAGSK